MIPCQVKRLPVLMKKIMTDLVSSGKRGNPVTMNVAANRQQEVQAGWSGIIQKECNQMHVIPSQPLSSLKQTQLLLFQTYWNGCQAGRHATLQFSYSDGPLHLVIWCCSHLLVLWGETLVLCETAEDIDYHNHQKKMSLSNLLKIIKTNMNYYI